MPSRSSIHSRRLALVLSAALGGALAANAHAQQPPQSSVQQYDIAAGPLTDALRRFAEQSGVAISLEADRLAGRRSKGLRGSYGVDEGFAALLAGSGWVASRTAAGYVLVPAPVGAAVLKAVQVQAAGVDGATEGTGSYTTGSTSAATGLNLSLRETPQSVTVITRQRLEDQALNDLGSALAQTPGISHSQGSGYGGYTYTYSRGYMIANFDIDGLPGGAGAVSMSGGGYYDISSLETAIYDSITVVRGSTGLLHPTGDPSGSISLTRKHPTSEFQASIEAGLGSWDKRRIVGDIAGPLNRTGSLRGRLVAVHDEGESWKDRYEGERNVAYGVVEADLTDATLLRLTLEHLDVDSHGDVPTAGLPVLMTDGRRAPFSVSDNPATDWSRYQRKSTSVSARLEHRFTENWQAVLDYSRAEGDHKGIYGTAAILNPDGITTLFMRNLPREQEWQAVNAKLSGSYGLFGRRHDLIVGFNADSNQGEMSFIQDRSQRTSWVNWNGGFPEPDWSLYTADLSETETKQNGLYLATRLRATDELSFLVGARWSNWKTKTKDQRTGSITDDRKESGVVTPYAAVTYDLTPQLSAYASYTEIFNPQSLEDTGGNVLDPEEGSNMELGLKGEWFAGRLNASAAIFQSGKDNLGVQDGNNETPQGNQAYLAADDTEGRGWEVEVSGELAPGWHLQGGYTRMVLEDSNGNRLATQNQPKHMVKLFSSWTPASLNRLTVGGGVRWQSEAYDAASPALRNTYTQDSYAVVDLMARYAFNDHLSLTANLNNAFDKTYRNHLMAYHVYGAPRHWNATLKYQF